VSEERRRAVEAAIEELRYRPNRAARSLAERRTRAIGVLVNDLRQPWLVDFLDGLGRVLAEQGLHPLVGDGRLDPATDAAILDGFLEMRVDGLVVAGTTPASLALGEAAMTVPTVVAGSRDFSLPNVDVVAQDDRLGVELALEHLHDLGHRYIAHVAGNTGRAFTIRRAAYEDWIVRHGLGAHAAVATCDTTAEGGYRAALELLDTDAERRPTALFVGNDLAGLGALAAAQERELAVPGELSLAGFDNSTLAQMRYVGLTSVDVAPDRAGQLAGAALVERIAEPGLAAREILLTPSLAVRRSTGPAPTRTRRRAGPPPRRP
jgi:DNA-binding LacI/PurR family transcriptional regulator